MPRREVNRARFNQSVGPARAAGGQREVAGVEQESRALCGSTPHAVYDNRRQRHQRRGHSMRGDRGQSDRHRERKRQVLPTPLRNPDLQQLCQDGKGDERQYAVPASTLDYLVHATQRQKEAAQDGSPQHGGHEETRASGDRARRCFWAARSRGGGPLLLMPAPFDLGYSVASLLRAIHGRVGAAQQRGDVRAVLGRRRDTHANRALELVAIVEDKCMPGNSSPQLFGEVDRFLSVRAGQQDHELLAAEARNNVALSEFAADLVGNLAQYLITGLVPELVVDSLEVIEIDERQ